MVNRDIKLDVTGWYWWEIDNVDLTGVTAGTYVYKGILETGVVDNYLNQYRPATWVTACSDSLSNGNVNELAATIVETPGNYYYLLDAEVTVNTYVPVTSGNTTIIRDSVCYARPTRVVTDSEIFPNMGLVFFCAEDENGDVSTNAVVIVNNTDPTRPQIQFIDPYNEPLLEDCF